MGCLLELEWKWRKIEWFRECLGFSSGSESDTCLTVTKIRNLSFEGEWTRVGWLDGEITITGVCGEGVGDAEERGELLGVVQGYASTSTSSVAGVETGTGTSFGFDGKAEM